MKYILSLFLFCLFQNQKAQAHSGHSHTAAPVATSISKFGAIESESPMSIGFKLHSGQEFGQYVGALPSINSFFGNDEISLNLNYELQVRQFSSDKQSKYEDRDFNNHFAARIKKSVSEALVFSMIGEYETSQATRIARMINDYNYTVVTSNLMYKFVNEWSLTAGYVYGLRQFPNGTYTIPSSSRSGAGEPIVPGQQVSTNQSITVEGTTDNLNEMVLASAGELGDQTINLETKYILNNSDLASRKYNAQAFKIGLEKMLWSRVFAQVSYGIENRAFSDRSDSLNVAEVGLQKELSARMSISGVARSNQIVSVESSSYWEGYAQLQYAF